MVSESPNKNNQTPDKNLNMLPTFNYNLPILAYSWQIQEQKQHLYYFLKHWLCKCLKQVTLKYLHSVDVQM